MRSSSRTLGKRDGARSALFAAVTVALVVLSVIGLPMTAQAAAYNYQYGNRAENSWKYSNYGYHDGGYAIAPTPTDTVYVSNTDYTSSAQGGVGHTYAREYNTEHCKYSGALSPGLLSCSYTY